MLWACPLFFLGVLLSDDIVSCEQQQQQVLKNLYEPTRIGILRRFVSNDGNPATAISQILRLAEQHGLDIWHANESVVDVYTPADAPSSLPAELANFDHDLIPLPPQRSSERSKKKKAPTTSTATATAAFDDDDDYYWDLTSLENSTFHDAYRPLEQVQSFLDRLVATFGPDTARLSNVGRSAEGRRMIALTISSGGYAAMRNNDNNKPTEKVGDDLGITSPPKKQQQKRRGGRKRRPPLRDGEKLGFVIMGAQHSREWIATSTALYLAHALVANSSDPYSLRRLLDHCDFHFVPVPNPDGYEYTWTTDRYWYKNRQVLGPYTKCIGLDMNRNWGHKWKSIIADNGNASSIDDDTTTLPTDPCSHWYPGTRPFESYEVNNIANWVRSLPNLAGFIDLRSYGQMLSSPFSFSCKRIPKDAEDQIEAATGATQALKSVHGTTFNVGTLCSTLYPAMGNVLDWMYAREGIKYSYVAHLRDTGTYGFSLPEKWIRPTGEETSQLLDYLARFIARQTGRQF